MGGRPRRSQRGEVGAVVEDEVGKAARLGEAVGEGERRQAIAVGRQTGEVEGCRRPSG